MTNIADLLRNAKKGTILWSPLFGPVEFMQLGKNDQIWIKVDNSEPFDKYGRYFGSRFTEAECLLFPSKDCRTWEGWKAPVEPNFKVGDWVVRKDGTTFCSGNYAEQITLIEVDGEGKCIWLSSTSWVCDDAIRLWTIQDAKDGDVLAAHECYAIFKEIDRLNIKCYCAYHYMGFNPTLYKNTLQNKTVFKPATKEQRDQLFAKMREAGYEWDEKKKKLKKIQKHYDISNFHTGMPVLVRDSNDQEWNYLLFSHYRKKMPDHFFAGGYPWYECIPFNEKTKHLLGTTDMCDEQYINW